MKKIGVAFLAAAAVVSMPLLAFGQDDEPAADEPAADEPAAPEGETPAKGEKGEGDDAGLGGICEIDPDACPKLDFDKEAARDIREQVFAVQQLFVLRRWRFEIQPYWQVPLNDQFVGHAAPVWGSTSGSPTCSPPACAATTTSRSTPKASSTSRCGARRASAFR